MGGVSALVHCISALDDLDRKPRQQALDARSMIEIREKRSGFDFEMP
jgi:hypothetical protein